MQKAARKQYKQGKDDVVCESLEKVKCRIQCDEKRCKPENAMRMRLSNAETQYGYKWCKLAMVAKRVQLRRTRWSRA